jgi:hypothetical protein
MNLSVPQKLIELVRTFNPYYYARVSFQHFGCVLEVHQWQVRDPATAVDTAE